MAIKRKGKAPAQKSAAPESGGDPIDMAVAKLTVSIKRRLSNGDEVFIAPGVEMHCSVEDLDTKQAEVTERVNGWLTELVEQYPDVDLDDEDDEDEDDIDEDDEDDGDEDLPSEADIKKMKKADLVALIEDEDLDVDTKQKIADIREDVIDALYDDDEDDEEDDEDEDDIDEDDEDDGDEDLYTEDELKDMKLADLQEVVDDWEIEHPKLKSGTKSAAKKKAYIALILEAQEEGEE